MERDRLIESQLRCKSKRDCEIIAVVLALDLYCRKLVRSGDAADLVSDVVVEFIRAYDSGQILGDAIAYSLGIAKRKAAVAYVNSLRLRCLAFDPPSLPPRDHWIRTELIPCLKQSITDKQLEVLELYDQGATTADIARRLGKAESTIREVRSALRKKWMAVCQNTLRPENYRAEHHVT